MKINDSTLIQAALDLGAAKAELISADQLVLDASFRDICATNACGLYNACHTCPPDAGEIHSLMAKLRQYQTGLWYQTISPLEDSYDFEGMMAAKKRHMDLSIRLRQRLEGLLPPGALHLGCGGCGLCDICTKPEGLPCRFPEDALYSLESHGVDVYQTTRTTGLSYINGANTVTYFGVVLFGARHEA